MSKEKNPLVEVENASLYIGKNKILKNLSFKIYNKEIIAIVGESGSGKSTVVQALIRTLPPPAVITGGEVIIDKTDVLSLSAVKVKKYRWKQVSIVMQSALNALNPIMTVEDQIKDVLETHKNIKGLKSRPNKLTTVKIAETWRPYRSVAALILWSSYD